MADLLAGTIHELCIGSRRNSASHGFAATDGTLCRLRGSLQRLRVFKGAQADGFGERCEERAETLG